MWTRAPQEVIRGAVWRGDARLFEAQQGVKILGIPVGQPGFGVFLEQKSDEHALLFERILVVEDPQMVDLGHVRCNEGQFLAKRSST